MCELLGIDAEKRLLESVEMLKNSRVKNQVDSRVKEFGEMRKKSSRDLFNELCYCILCANYAAERSMKIQAAMGDGFSALPEYELASKLRLLGHRFPISRAKYIVEARRIQDALKDIVSSFNNDFELREWFARNVRGVGLKEASHFLRNIGFMNFAILDFHIINILVKFGLILKPRTLTKRRYLQIEGMLRSFAARANLSLGELDLYLWYMETAKVLK